MSSTSGTAIKQNIKEDFDDGDKSIEVMKFECEEEMFLDLGSEINDRDQDFSCNIREDGFSEELLKILEEKCFKQRDRVIREGSFKCEFCPKKYRRNDILIRHTNHIHKKDKQKKFECNICGYVTVNKSHLKRHFKIHDKTKLKIKLQVLGKNNLKNKIKNEIKITSKTYQCTKCTYSTFHKSHYDNHVKVCLKLKNINWYQCEVCHYKTTKKNHLNTHLKTHSIIKELKCLFCQYEASRKISFDNHMLTKHLDMLDESNKNIITSKIHNCQKCNYKTTKISTFKLHLKNNH
ncbi:unnamed protein product [Brassicogethes aeneus]|uniref:C2H2-type domain-containing protein n=1 Tax=Brassicogethes aeneus TaxID=1431903 RepID=A0A9P0AVC7_BRAAE|nr:unnamed protein product [Brassicogethes aeneus]